MKFWPPNEFVRRVLGGRDDRKDPAFDRAKGDSDLALPDGLFDPMSAEDLFDPAQEALEHLRHDGTEIACPDLSSCILARVGKSHGLLSACGLNRLFTYRYACVAGLAFAIGLGFYSYATWSRAHGPAEGSPIHDLASAVPQRTQGVITGVQSAVDSLDSTTRDHPLHSAAQVQLSSWDSRQSGASDSVMWPSAMKQNIAAVLWCDSQQRPSTCSASCVVPACASSAQGSQPPRVSLRTLLVGRRTLMTAREDAAPVSFAR